MLLWTVLGAVAVFLGSWTGSISPLAVLIVGLWAFVGGLCVAISPKTGDLGLNTLVALIVYAARGAMGLEGAAKAGALVLLGGLLQMIFALVFWPFRKTNPERRVLSDVYAKLAKELDPATPDTFDLQLKSPPQQVQDVLDALGRDHTVEGERFRLLFDQADRIRMSTFVVERLRTELGHAERDGSHLCGEVRSELDAFLALSAEMLHTVATCLIAEVCAAEEPALRQRLAASLEAGHDLAKKSGSASLVQEAASAMDVLAGQLRVVLTFASQTTADGAVRLEKQESLFPLRLRLENWIGTLRANLHPSSTYFRHAVRLSVCAALADAIGRSISLQRSYWLPMTVAVVLKPDFTTTYTRGVLRLAGTFGGLLIATLLYHLLPVASSGETAVSELVLVGLFTFALRSIGPANYGVFSVAISGLIVFLVAATGVPPKDVVAQRAVNTIAGGVFALVAYALWPTWERTQAGELIAEMLDEGRQYFHEVSLRLGQNTATAEEDLDPLRMAWRRARSNAETSIDRLAAEPGTTREQTAELTSMLASSHGLVHAMMGLEASLIRSGGHPAPEAFSTFAHDVEFTLYFLAAALRGSRAASDTLPKLREDHRRMVESRDKFAPEGSFILLEADRLTVSLNTLREQVLRYVTK